jgi:Uma2 family endonuclease
MSTVPQRSRYHHTFAEYLAYEADSGMKHEYDDGEIIAMAGGSRRHNALAAKVTTALENGRKRDCVVFQSDQRVRIVATGKATYPDVSMVCGPIEGDPADPNGDTIVNPTVIVEVLSPSTEQNDRGSKWQHYQQLGSLREYVLVSQAERRLEYYRRLPNGAWEYRDVVEGTLELECGPVLELATLYADLPP